MVEEIKIKDLHPFLGRVAVPVLEEVAMDKDNLLEEDMRHVAWPTTRRMPTAATDSLWWGQSLDKCISERVPALYLREIKGGYWET